MKSVMISIHPKWCELIASGEKTVEVRKTRPKIEVPFKCYIYETKGKTDYPTFIDEDGHEIYEGRGQVIGEFVCDKIYEFVHIGVGIIVVSPAEYEVDSKQALLNSTCLTEQQITDYIGNKRGYGWHISDLMACGLRKATRGPVPGVCGFIMLTVLILNTVQTAGLLCYEKQGA